MPKTDFSQLLSLKGMVEHYQLHVDEAKAIGRSFDVFDFIYIHYINPDAHVSDESHDHSNLPLNHVSSVLNIITIDLASMDIMPNTLIHLDIFEYAPESGVSPLCTIFHPPIV